MASRLQEHKARSREHRHHVSSRAATDPGEMVRTDEHEDLKHDLDDLLDDIDAVLEENAEEFVAAFVQRGGE